MKYKIIRIYKLDAESRYDAMKQFRVRCSHELEEDLLTDEFATEDRSQEMGWLATAMTQFLGR